MLEKAIICNLYSLTDLIGTCAPSQTDSKQFQFSSHPLDRRICSPCCHKLCFLLLMKIRLNRGYITESFRPQWWVKGICSRLSYALVWGYTMLWFFSNIAREKIELVRKHHTVNNFTEHGPPLPYNNWHQRCMWHRGYFQPLSTTSFTHFFHPLLSPTSFIHLFLFWTLFYTFWDTFLSARCVNVSTNLISVQHQADGAWESNYLNEWVNWWSAHLLTLRQATVLVYKSCLSG